MSRVSSLRSSISICPSTQTWVTLRFTLLARLLVSRRGVHDAGEDVVRRERFQLDEVDGNEVGLLAHLHAAHLLLDAQCARAVDRRHLQRLRVTLASLPR